MTSTKEHIHNSVTIPVLSENVRGRRMDAHAALRQIAERAQHKFVTPCTGTDHLAQVVSPLLRDDKVTKLVPVVGDVAHDARSHHAVIPVWVGE